MPDQKTGCPFCNAEFTAAAIDREAGMLAVADIHPVTVGHLLIVPVEHYPDYFALPDQLRRAAGRLLDRQRRRILAEDPAVTGFNIGMNCGASAGQTVPHAHIHLIPRRDGDVLDPQGGVRGCVPERMGY